MPPEPEDVDALSLFNPEDPGELWALVRDNQIVIERSKGTQTERVDLGHRAHRSRRQSGERRPSVGGEALARAVGSNGEGQRRLDSQEVEHVSVETSRIAARLTALEARLASIAGEGQGLERAEQVVAHLEHRAAQARTDLDQRVGEFKEQKQAIDRALGEATRVTNVLAGLERRIADLTENDQLIDRAAAYVGHLEGRVATAALRLESIAGDERLATRRVKRPALIAGVGVSALLGLGLAATGYCARTSTPAAEHKNLGAAASAPLPRDGLLSSGPSVSSAQGPPAGTATIDVKGDVDVPEGLSPVRERPTPLVSAYQYTGDLLIDSEPGPGTVFVDQQRVGETPVDLKALRAGSHVVRIEREGYERWTTSALVVADQQTRVSARLQPDRHR